MLEYRHSQRDYQKIPRIFFVQPVLESHCCIGNREYRAKWSDDGRLSRGQHLDYLARQSTTSYNRRKYGDGSDGHRAPDDETSRRVTGIYHRGDHVRRENVKDNQPDGDEFDDREEHEKRADAQAWTVER